MDPGDPNIVYAATGGYTGAGAGVYKSKDAGVTWTPATNGLPNQSVVALIILPGVSPTLLASLDNGNGVYASSDGAATWSPIGKPSGGGSATAQMFVVSATKKSIYAVVGDQGIMRSDNGGQSWTPSSDGLPKDSTRFLVLTLVADPGDPKILYACTGGFVGQGAGVYKSNDGGDTWLASNKGMLDYRISALAVDPRQSQTIYAGSDSGSLFKSADGGQNWTNLSDRLILTQSSHPEIHSIQIDTVNGLVYLLADYSGVLYSGDGGNKWRMLGIPGALDQPRFISMGIAFSDKPVIILTCMDDKGVWRFSATP